jgi:hypothetical protein
MKQLLSPRLAPILDFPASYVKKGRQFSLLDKL